MIIAGLDLSINSSGLTKLYLDNECNVIKTEFMGFTTTKKHERENVFYYKKDQFTNYIEQNFWMLEKIQPFIEDVEYLAIEDYAFGAKGQVFHIGEFIGFLKHTFFSNNKKIRLYDPNSIKLFASGRGQCDKLSMYESFIECEDLYKPDLRDLPVVETSKGKSPTSDIVDSFYISKLLLYEMKLRKGLILLKDLDENSIKVFNRVTKNNPINILAQDFIEKS